MDYSYFELIDREVKLIKRFLESANLLVQRSPFTPNLFTLWRYMSIDKIKSELNQAFQKGEINAQDQIKLMRAFVDQVDNNLFYQFKSQIQIINLQKSKEEKITFFDSLNLNGNQKQIYEIIERDLIKEEEDFIKAFSEWQIEIEHSYDLLNRVESYELASIRNKNYINEVSAIQLFKNQNIQNSKGSKLYDLAIKKLVKNVEQMASSKVKEICQTDIVKKTLIETGKSYLWGLYERRNIGLNLLSGFNGYFFIAGLIAQPIIKLVGSKAIGTQIRDKLIIQTHEIRQMTSTIKQVNIQLDDLIWKSFAQSNTEDEYSQQRIKVNLFVQKYFSVDVDSDLIYCQESDSVIQTIEDDDDCVIVSENNEITKQLNLSIHQSSVFVEAKLSQTDKIYVVQDYMQ